MRCCADTFFAQRYGHRAIVLETVAAVPGMVGATVTHLRCLRRMVGDDGWIRTLLEEAENERMHLMTFVAIARPTAFERLLVMLAQWVFYVCFFARTWRRSTRAAHPTSQPPSHGYASELAGEAVDSLQDAPHPEHADGRRADAA